MVGEESDLLFYLLYGDLHLSVVPTPGLTPPLALFLLRTRVLPVLSRSTTTLSTGDRPPTEKVGREDRGEVHELTRR